MKMRPCTRWCLAGFVAVSLLTPSEGAHAQKLSGATIDRPESGRSNTIVLPQRLVAGQPATLAVLGPDGRLLPGAEVEFSGEVHRTTDSTGRATFQAPRQPGVMLVRLADDGATASAIVDAPAPSPPDGVQVHQLPRVALLNEKFHVSGTGFRGEADANQVRLGDQPAVVLAASPVSLVVIPGPGCTPGPAQFLLEVDGRSPGPLPIRLVALELVLDQPRLAAGERASLRVRAVGTDELLVIEARNLTPGVVRLVDGDVQRVTTRGGADNVASLRVEGVRPGDYSVSLRLIRSASGLPDTESSRRHLLAARAIAPQGWFARVDRLIGLLEENPQNALKVRNELEKMLADPSAPLGTGQPEGEFGRLLEAAWRALL